MPTMAPIARFVSPGLRQLALPRPCLSELLNLQVRTRPAARYFAYTPLLRATRKPAVTPRKPSPPVSTTPRLDANARTSYAFVKSLASRATPTTLYEGPSHFWFYFGCWGSGLGILSWTALTGPSLIHQPSGLPTWITVTYSASYVILCAMGFYLISRTHNVVSQIRVLPTQAASRPGTSAPSLKMEVTVKSMLPFVKPKTVVTDVADARLTSRLSLPEHLVPGLRRQAVEQEKAMQQEQHKFDMNHILTMPFRRMGRAFVALFNGVRGAWTDMGFGKMNVAGKTYKIDVTNGFAHDGFRTLEKLVPIE